jgi:predicted secreted protein
MPFIPRHTQALAAAAIVCGAAATAAQAQAAVMAPPQNVVQLSAAGSVEVAQDCWC